VVCLLVWVWIVRESIISLQESTYCSCLIPSLCFAFLLCLQEDLSEGAPAKQGQLCEIVLQKSKLR
jgi:hypothetical protein